MHSLFVCSYRCVLNFHNISNSALMPLKYFKRFLTAYLKPTHLFPHLRCCRLRSAKVESSSSVDTVQQPLPQNLLFPVHRQLQQIDTRARAW